MAKIIQLENKVDAVVSNEDNEEYERYIPVEQSIIGSLLEVREMIAGRKPKITWDEFSVELHAMIEEERQKENAAQNHRTYKTLRG